MNEVETSVGNVDKRVKVVSDLTEASIQVQEGVNKIDEAKSVKISDEDKEKLIQFKKDLFNDFGRISRREREDEIGQIARNFSTKETKYGRLFFRGI